MSSDPDDALSWEGDDPALRRDSTPTSAASTADPALPGGWNAVGKGSRTVGRVESDGSITPADAPAPVSTPMLVTLGVIGGIYLLYAIGWVIGGLRLQGQAPFLVTDVMYQASLWTAVLAPALWFACAWVLTRRSRAWVRVAALVGGVVLLVPWPFVMLGVWGS